MRSSPSPAESRFRALLTEHARSGLTLAEFARRHGVPVGTLSCWRFKLKTRDAALARSKSLAQAALVPVRIVPERTPAASASCPTPPSPRAPFEVILRSGRLLRVAQDFDPTSLKALVGVLEATC